MSTVKQLNDARIKALSKYNDLRHERDEKYNRLLAGQRLRINKDLESEYGPALDRLSKIADAATAAHAEAVEKEALTGKGSRHPIGTKMVQWRSRGWPHYDRVKTGRVGIIEPITRESKHPGNIGSYSRAKVGDFVIRALVNGKPGLTYVTPSYDGNYHGWLPEGVEPKNAEKGE